MVFSDRLSHSPVINTNNTNWQLSYCSSWIRYINYIETNLITFFFLTTKFSLSIWESIIQWKYKSLIFSTYKKLVTNWNLKTPLSRNCRARQNWRFSSIFLNVRLRVNQWIIFFVCQWMKLHKLATWTQARNLNVFSITNQRSAERLKSL